MTTHEYEGATVYYVEEFTQLAFPLSRSGSSLPSSLIHRMRDKAMVVQTIYEPPTPVIPANLNEQPAQGK